MTSYTYYSSSDGDTWKQLDLNITKNITAENWKRVYVTPKETEMLIGSQYLKIVIHNDNANWTPQLAELLLFTK
jgi:hypothetical protein